MMMMMMFQNLMQYESVHIAVPITQPDFKDTKINIPNFENTIKANKLDTGLLSLEAKLHETWKLLEVSKTGTSGNATPSKWVCWGKHGIYIYIYIKIFLNHIILQEKKNDTHK
jgi:hypothetical protein